MFLLGGLPHPQIFGTSLQAPSSVTASLALAGTAVAALSAGSRKVSEAMGFHSCLDAGAVFFGWVYRRKGVDGISKCKSWYTRAGMV